jgi:hypothetical protein
MIFDVIGLYAPAADAVGSRGEKMLPPTFILGTVLCITIKGCQ